MAELQAGLRRPAVLDRSRRQALLPPDYQPGRRPARTRAAGLALHALMDGHPLQPAPRRVPGQRRARAARAARRPARFRPIGSTARYTATWIRPTRISGRSERGSAGTRPPEPANLAQHRIRRKQVLAGLTHQYYIAALPLTPPLRKTQVTTRITFSSPTAFGVLDDHWWPTQAARSAAETLPIPVPAISPRRCSKAVLLLSRGGSRAGG